MTRSLHCPTLSRGRRAESDFVQPMLNKPQFIHDLFQEFAQTYYVKPKVLIKSSRKKRNWHKVNKDPKYKKTTSDKRQNMTFGVLRKVCGAVQNNGIRRWRGPSTDSSGNEVRNGENKENESPPGISANLKLLQPKRKKVDSEPLKEKILHASEHPSSFMLKEDYFADICLIPRRRCTQHRSGCNLIPAVHRKEHLSMKQSTQQTMTEKAVLKEQECLAKSVGNAPKRTRSGRVVRPSLRYRDWPQWYTNLFADLRTRAYIIGVNSFLVGSSGMVAADRRIGFYFSSSVFLWVCVCECALLTCDGVGSTIWFLFRFLRIVISIISVVAAKLIFHFLLRRCWLRPELFTGLHLAEADGLRATSGSKDWSRKKRNTYDQKCY